MCFHPEALPGDALNFMKVLAPAGTVCHKFPNPMSDFKFSCAHCGQHITADEAWAGRQTKCPGCQGDIIIPSVPTTAVPPPVLPPQLAIAAQRTASPPPLPSGGSPNRRVAGAESPLKFWLLAVASPFLMLFVIPLAAVGIVVTKSWLGGLISLVACFPALVCARLALNERQTRRGVRESQLSGIGAIAAWVGLVFAGVWLGLTLIGFCRFSYYKITGTTPPQSRWSYSSSPTDSSVPRSMPRPPFAPPVPPAPRGLPSTKPAEPPVATDPQSVTIPEGVPSGTVLGGDFKCTGISYDAMQSLLSISQGNGMDSRASIQLFLWLNSQPLAGKSIIITPDQDMSAQQPHVHLKGVTGRTDSLVQGYVLRSEFSQRDSKGILTGKIYLELPQSYETKVSGTFKLAAQ